MSYSIQIAEDGQKTILGTHIMVNSGLFMQAYGMEGHYYDIVLNPYYHDEKPALKIFFKVNDKLISAEDAINTYELGGNIFLFDSNDIVPLCIIYDNGIIRTDESMSPYDMFGNIISILSFTDNGSNYSTRKIIISDEEEYYELLNCVKEIFSDYINSQSLLFEPFKQRVVSTSNYLEMMENFVNIYGLKSLFQNTKNIAKVEADWSLFNGLDCSYFHQILLSSEYDRYQNYLRFYPGDAFLERLSEFPKYFKERVYTYPTSFINTTDECNMYSQEIKQNLDTFLDLLNVDANDRATFFWLTYIGLYQASVKIFAEEFTSKFGCCFDDINSLSVEEIIYTSLNCKDFDQDYDYNITLLTYYLMKTQRTKDNYNIFNAERELRPIINIISQKIQMNRNKKIMLEKLMGDNNTVERISLDDIDLMTGEEFELFVSDYFKKQGYRTEITKASGDQGIDVIAEKGSIRIGIQVKCYSGNVGNAAVQEAVAGKAFYKLDKVMVITNSHFTSSAVELAQVNNVILWDRTILKEKL